MCGREGCELRCCEIGRECLSAEMGRKGQLCGVEGPGVPERKVLSERNADRKH